MSAPEQTLEEKLTAYLESVEASEKTPIRIDGQTYAFINTYVLREAIGWPKGD